MLGILASFVIAAAGVVAVMVIVHTVRQQMPSVRKLVADARSISQDREFLVKVTAETQDASPVVFARLRRVPQRSVRRLAPHLSGFDHLRAA